MSPLCENFLQAQQLDEMEPYCPLHVLICEVCLLVQLKQYVSSEAIFQQYAYFSSYSTSWVAHAAAYVRMITDRLRLGPESRVVELASNDGYLLQHFAPLGVPYSGSNQRPTSPGWQSIKVSQPTLGSSTFGWQRSW